MNYYYASPMHTILVHCIRICSQCYQTIMHLRRESASAVIAALARHVSKLFINADSCVQQDKFAKTDNACISNSPDQAPLAASMCLPRSLDVAAV